MHCHLDTHSDTGMMIMIRVGTEKDFPLEKPTNWPSCGLSSEMNQSKNLANSLNFNFSLNLFILLFYLRAIIIAHYLFLCYIYVLKNFIIFIKLKYIPIYTHIK